LWQLFGKNQKPVVDVRQRYRSRCTANSSTSNYHNAKAYSCFNVTKCLSKAGSYTITEADGGMHHAVTTDEKASWLATYKPILLIGAFITGITLLIETTSGAFNWESWMQNFMAAFFLVFSFFKMLDLKGFAESYSTYDLVAKKWMGWGYIYAFIELLLGITFLIRFNPFGTSAVTLIVMTISIIGVL
jgi:hypothetical protein